MVRSAYPVVVMMCRFVSPEHVKMTTPQSLVPRKMGSLQWLVRSVALCATGYEAFPDLGIPEHYTNAVMAKLGMRG